MNWSTTNATSVSISNGVSSTALDGSENVTPGTTTTYTLTAANSLGDTVTSAVTVNVYAAPVIDSFNAAPTTITSGNNSTLSWQTTSATAVSINNGVSSTALDGSEAVTPAISTTYTLSASNPAGRSVTATATVTVVAAPVIDSFTATAATITNGNNTTLQWTTTNATSVSINNGVTSTALNGSESVAPTTTTTYTLTATNDAGDNVTSTVTVTVVAPPVIDSFTASPTTITSGGNSTLDWSTTDATSTAIDAFGVVLPDGSVIVSPSSTTTYTLTATNDAGDSVTETVTVTVVPAPAIDSFSATKTTITTGSNTTLQWTTSDATSVSIDNGVASTDLDGQEDVSPGTTTTYTLTATNDAGDTATGTVTITVVAPPVIDSFTATATTIVGGNSSELSWTTTGATVVSIDNGVASTALDGNETVSPGTTTTYTLTATNDASDSVTETVTITVQYQISGTVREMGTGMSGVTVQLTGSSTDSTTTNGSGAYSFIVSGGGDYTVTPENTAYDFSPASLSFNAVAVNRVDQDFTATLKTYTVTFQHDGDGSLVGDLIQTIDHGADTTEVVAANNATHHFSSWTGPNSFISTDAALTITNVTADATYTANYERDTGTLTVEIEPDFAVSIGAQWSAQFLNSPQPASATFYDSGASVELETGDYLVSFTDVPRYDTPAPITVSVSRDATTTLTSVSGALYKKSPGALTIHFNAEAAADGARWRFSSENEFHASGDRIDSIPSGDYTVVFRAIDGWKAPPPLAITILPDGDHSQGIQYQRRQGIAPTIHYFEALPETIGEGDSSKLRWNIENADSIAIEGLIEDAAAAGSVNVSPEETSTYRIVAANAFGTSTGAVTVAVVSAPVINWFTTSARENNPIAAGASATITWNISGATSADLSPGGNLSGADVIDPKQGSTRVTANEDTVYILTAGNAFGTATAELVVHVTDLPVIEQFVAEPSTIAILNASRLTWSVRGATTHSISPDIGNVAAEGSRSVSPDSTTSYTLTATNAVGTVSRTLRLGVATETAELSVAIDAISAGGEETRNVSIGQPVQFSLIVKNEGDATASDVDVALKLRGVVVALGRIGSVPAGAERSIALTWLPVKTGRFRLEATVDPFAAVAEKNNRDNTDRSRGIRVRAVDQPDLLVTGLSFELLGAGAPQGAVRIGFTLHNVGNTDVEGFQLRAHLLRNRNADYFGAGDQVVINEAVDALAAGESITYSRTVLMENSWRRFILVVLSDSFEAIGEAREDNNDGELPVDLRELQ